MTAARARLRPSSQPLPRAAPRPAGGIRKLGRVVECTGLENRQRRKAFVSSYLNPVFVHLVQHLKA